jgi:hypothetical protein
VAAVDASVGAPPPKHTSKLFPIGGYAVLRDGWDANSMHALVDAGPLGAMNCGHAHSDALSIEVSAGGCPFLVDPGTYTYTESASDRNHFRHSAAHNTVTVDGESASVPDGPFSWTSRADARAESWWTGDVVDRVTASHAGFERLADPVTHHRSVYFVRGEYWVVVDTLLAAGEHESTAHFHAALGSRVVSVTPSSARIDAPCAEGRGQLFFAAVGDVDALEWGEDWVSPSYGSRARAPYVRVTSRGRGRRDLVTVLCPSPDGGSVSVEEIPTEEGKGRAVVVSRPDKHDLFVFGTGSTVCLKGVTMDAEAALVRRCSPAGDVTALALFGANARLAVDGLSFHATDAAEAVRASDGWKVNGVGEIAVPA